MKKMNGKKEVRILLVGDSGVGKTSLIFSLVSEEFSEEVPAKAEEITIPPDVTPERVNTQIVDFSAQEQNEETLYQEIHRANVICVVYSVVDDGSIEKITSYWLPLIRKQLGEDHDKPIVLVGNKIDLVDYSSLDLILPIMNQYSEVETCLECSAKTLKNTFELFYYAQKAVLHPTSPLYSSKERDLTLKCKKALSRIFKICDYDNDGLLNDQELNKFQKRCFNSLLQVQALEDVKNVVKNSVADGISEDGLTLNGFLFLNCLFIQRGRHETTWTVLRKFGYNDKIELDSTYLNPFLEVPVGSTTEITYSGIQFLTNLFFKYDVDKDSLLSDSELSSLFSTCPSIPFYFKKDFYLNTVPLSAKGWLDLHSYLCLWILMTYIEVRKTLEYFAYLGFIEPPEDTQLSAINVTRNKLIDLQKKQTTRTVFTCHIIGLVGSGKSTFMRGFLGQSLKEQQLIKSETKTKLPKYAINTVKIYGQEKYLILREIDIFDQTDKLTDSEMLCDVICLLYNSNDPKSFEHITRIYLENFKESKVPILVISAKSDLKKVAQQTTIQPQEFCMKHKLPPLINFSIDNVSITKQEVYIKLGTMAAYPNLRRLVNVLMMRPASSWVTQRFSDIQDVLTTDTGIVIRAGVGIATIAVVGFFILKIMRSNPR